MTCKDCINYDVCKKLDDNAQNIIADLNQNIADHELDEDGSEYCVAFKSKARFEEIVRCRDCKWHVKRSGFCERLNEYFPEYYDDFYCKFGEREGESDGQ